MPMKFEMDGDLGRFVPTDPQAANERLDKLRRIMDEAADTGSLTESIETVSALLAEDPGFLRGHAMLAELCLDEGLDEQADQAHAAGCQAGLELIPKDFQGPLDMENPDVQCFIRCHAGQVKQLAEAGAYAEALEAAYRQLTFDPDDLCGQLEELGELAIAAGQEKEAAQILAEQTDDRPCAWYGLAYLSFKSGDFTGAITRLRRAFLLAPYAAVFMAGGQAQPNPFWEQGPQSPRFEEEFFYAETLGGELWQQDEPAMAFFHWLAGSSQVLSERAAAVVISEKCLAAGGVDAKSQRAFEALYNAISDKSSADLAAELDDPVSGDRLSPWELWALHQSRLAEAEDCGCGDPDCQGDH